MSLLLRKKKIWLGITCFLIAGSITMLFMGNILVGTPQYLGTWIWDATLIQTDRDAILQFSEQNGVTNIYVQIDDRVKPKDYALFIREAGQRGIEVEALGGKPTWGLVENRPQLQHLVEWVASYNLNVNEDERFSGIHLDIEPYLLPNWHTESSSIVEEWLANMEFVAVHADLFASDLELSADLPFWVKKIKVPGYEDYDVGTWMQKRFDRLVIMNYRDQAEGSNGIIANGQEIVNEASDLDKRVVIAVEMSPSDEGSHTTFYEDGHERLEQELEIVRQQFRKYNGFEGFAIHGFSHWVSSKGE